VVEGDFDADGVVDTRTTYSYDDSGNRVLAEFDFDADGIVDNSNSYTSLAVKRWAVLLFPEVESAPAGSRLP
jgi:hypothetical protein